MQPRSILRTPYHSRAIVRSSATGPIDERSLDGAIALTQLALLVLCAARVAADWFRGPLGIEGALALALLCTVVASLLAKVVAWALGARGPSFRWFGSRF